MVKTRLGVNIDHVATIRNARGEEYPDPLRVALIAQESGAASITIHLREDRRHIKDIDVYNEILYVAIGSDGVAAFELNDSSLLTMIDIYNTTAMANKNPITNLTRTEDALLSPTEKVIARKTNV